jgi:hypothetical protein
LKTNYNVTPYGDHGTERVKVTLHYWVSSFGG